MTSTLCKNWKPFYLNICQGGFEPTTWFILCYPLSCTCTKNSKSSKSVRLTIFSAWHPRESNTGVKSWLLIEAIVPATAGLLLSPVHAWVWAGKQKEKNSHRDILKTSLCFKISRWIFSPRCKIQGESVYMDPVVIFFKTLCVHQHSGFCSVWSRLQNTAQLQFPTP